MLTETQCANHMAPPRKHIVGFLFSLSATFLIFLIFTLAALLQEAYQLGRKNETETASNLKSAGPSLGMLANYLHIIHLTFAIWGLGKLNVFLNLRLLIAGFRVTSPGQLER